MAFGTTTERSLYCRILDIHRSLIQLLPDVSREHEHRLCPWARARHAVLMFACLDFHAAECTAHIKYAGGYGLSSCLCLVFVCLNVWSWALIRLSCKEFSACMLTCITWSQSKRSDIKRREHRAKAEDFSVRLHTEAPAQGYGYQTESWESQGLFQSNRWPE